MLFFLADKLAWDRGGIPPFFQAVSAALDRLPAHASLAYIEDVMDLGMILSPHSLLLPAVPGQNAPAQPSFSNNPSQRRLNPCAAND